jgi:N-methylhydantoinase A/oxoprolinase/acetone carboxylase beta subunit
VSLRLGVDVGGTNTDAVIFDERARLLARFKSPTTADVTSGIRDAVNGLLQSNPRTDVGQGAARGAG